MLDWTQQTNGARPIQNAWYVKVEEKDEESVEELKEKIKKLEEENRELRLKTCGKDWKDFEKQIDKDIKIEELEQQIIELTAKLNMKEHEPAYCELADRKCEYLGKLEDLRNNLWETEELLEVFQDKCKELENKNKKLDLEAQKYYDEMVELNLKIKENRK